MAKSVFVSLVSLGYLVVASPAFAHAVLKSAEPAPQAHVDGPQVPIVLTFNSRIDATRSRLLLKPANGEPRSLTATGGDTPAILKSAADGLAPGTYTLHWEVLSVDGHITRGDYAFAVGTP